jgi:hypothetical protein
MLKVGIPLLLAAVSVALLAPKKVRNALGVLGIVGILAALWAIGVLVVLLDRLVVVQDTIKVTGPMLRVGVPLLVAVVSAALLAPKKVRNALGVLGIVGILAALWAIGILVVVLVNLPVPQ